MFESPINEALSGVAILLTLIAFVPYIKSILQGSTKPHIFSWVIWGATTFVVFLAQLEAKGGVGAWPIGVSGVITIFIAVLAYLKRADISITKIDWLFFIMAMSSLPLWYFTANPLWAVITLTITDLLGFGPTLRKVYASPQSETVLFFSLFALRNFIVLLALESYSVTTVLFPVVIGLACLVVVTIIVYRRKTK